MWFVELWTLLHGAQHGAFVVLMESPVALSLLEFLIQMGSYHTVWLLLLDAFGVHPWYWGDPACP